MLLSTPLRAFYLTSLFLSWLLFSVVAAPVGHGHGHGASASATPLQSSAVDFIAWLQTPANAAMVNAKPICFYSGSTTINGKPVHTSVVMKRFSAERGCNYMRTVLSMAKVNPGGWQNPEWAAVSEALAAVAENTPVYVLLGVTVDSKSVWIQNEKPKLQERLRANKIQTVAKYSFSKQGSKYVFTPAGDLEH